MQSAASFVIEFSKMIYKADPSDLVPFIDFPVAVMTPHLDLVVSSEGDLTKVLDSLRKGLEMAGVTRMERSVSGVVQTDPGFSVVVLNVSRFGENDEELGSHRSTFALASDEQSWKVKSLSVRLDDPATGGLTQVERQFVKHYWRDINAVWKDPDQAGRSRSDGAPTGFEEREIDDPDD
jgi:hypothetical protein